MNRPRPGTTAASDTAVNVLCLVKGDERYVWLYDNDQRAEMLRSIGRFAAEPQLEFSWYDAAVLCQKVRQQQEGNG